MKIEVIKNSINDLLVSQKNKYYQSKFSDEREKINEIYNVYEKYYLKIINNDSFSNVYKLKEEILKSAISYEKKYNDALNQYKELSSVSEKNKLSFTINSYVNHINALNTLYNILEEELNIEDSNVLENSNTIIELIKKADNEKNIEEKNKLLSQIYNIKDERRAKFTSSYSESILEKINYLESLEYRIARCSDEEQKPYRLDKKAFIQTVKDTIKAINDFYYLEFKNSQFFKKKDKNDYSKLNVYLSKYHSLLYSSFKEKFHIIETNNGKISSDDLLNYLSVYNMDNNYEVFIAKNKNNKIGNEKINKESYTKNVNLMNGFINKLIEDLNAKIKGKYIDVVSEIDLKNELINERKSIIFDIEEFNKGNIYGGMYEVR